MGRKAVEKELNRDQILQAARELFVTKGYREVSMRGIAQVLGYSHGAIYYHFKDKAELFNTLVEHDFYQLKQKLQDLLTEGTLDKHSRVEKVMLEFVRFGLDFPHHYEIMFLINDPELLQYAQPIKEGSYSQFSSVIVEACGTSLPPEKRIIIPWLTLLSLQGFVAHYLHAKMSFGEVEYLAKEHIKFICKGLF